jgi:ABC-type transporter Mla subunit MlaD
LFARTGAPLLAGLRASAPQLQRLMSSLPPFARVGSPAIRDLGSALTRARPLVRRLTPQFRQLGTFGEHALPAGQLVSQLFTNVRDRGGVEGLLALAYGLAAGGARYDATSHLLPLNAIVNNCSFYSEVPTPGCQAGWGPKVAAAPARHPSRAGHHAQPAPQRTPSNVKPQAPTRSPALRLPRLPHVPSTREPSPPEAVKRLLDYLLR